MKINGKKYVSKFVHRRVESSPQTINNRRHGRKERAVHRLTN
jgi:hypothetical protein